MLQLQNNIQTSLLKSVSGTTTNIYDYLIAITKSFQSQILVTYELNNISNTNSFYARDVVKEFEVVIRLTTTTIKQSQNLEPLITQALYSLMGANVVYVGLTSSEQPNYDVEKQMYSSAYNFNLQWTN